MALSARIEDEIETPRDLVAYVMRQNPNVDIDKIKLYVWNKIADDETWLHAFVDDVTTRYAQSVLREEREERAETLAPKGFGNASDKFVRPVAIGLNSRGAKPGASEAYVRVGSKRLPIPQTMSADDVARAEATRQRRAQELREYQNKSNAAMSDAVKHCTQHMMKISLLSLPMVNGKLLSQCTYGECAQFAGWFKLLALQGRPDNELVGKRMTEEELRKIQTWSD